MAIVKMNKFTLLTFESKKEKLLKSLQSFSNVELINLQNNELLENNEILEGLFKDCPNESSEFDEEASKAKFALEYLEGFVPKPSGLTALKEGKPEYTLLELEEKVNESEWHKIYDKVKEKYDIMKNLENEDTKLKNDVSNLLPWENLDIKLKDFREIKSPHFLGSIPKLYEENFKEVFNDSYIEEISRDNNDIYYLIISLEKEEVIRENLRNLGFVEAKFEEDEMPLKLIHDYNERISTIVTEKFFLQESLANFEEELKILKLVNEYYNNKFLRKEVVNKFLKTENITIIQGWNSVDDNDELISIVKTTLGDEGYITFEDVKEEEIDYVPIKLKNNNLNSTFEPITSMYSLPKYNEIDPTPLLAPFYLLFFGMMVADIGYGALMTIGTLIALKYFKFDDGMKKNIKFFFYLSISVIFFGLVYGSFFGDAIDLPRLIDPQKDVTSVLLISVIFGVIQIFVGLGIKAYVLIRDGNIKDAIYDVGTWVITLVSIGIFAIGKMTGLSSTVVNIFLVLMVIGMISIVLTQGRHSKGIGGKLGQGLYGLYGITGYVSDIISYTRLMALGLAGGSIAAAFNMIVDMLPGAAVLIIGPVFFVAFHMFNLALSLLGAYVHTCRLQYVEYFSKFYEGGGKQFDAFTTSKKYVNIVKKD